MSYPGAPPQGGWPGMPQQQGWQQGPPYPGPPGPSPPTLGPGGPQFGFSSPGGYAPSPGGPSPGFPGAGGYGPPGGPFGAPPGPYQPPPPGQYPGGSTSWNPRNGPPAASPYASPPPPGSGYHGQSFQTAPMGQAHMPPSTPQMGGQWGGMNQPQQYQYSQCTGKKKALCIGINYFNTDAELKGCINDARNMKQFLIQRFGFKDEDIVMLLDDARHPRQIPTRQNIVDAMRWLVTGAQPNDSLWLHYSGHGGQTKDRDGDEHDGYDETIYPVDFEIAGHLVDDEMHDILVRSLPIGCRLTAIFDSCHSGSALDLPYIYSTEGKIKEPNQAAEAGKNALEALQAYGRKDMGGVLKAGMGLFKVATGAPDKATKIARETKTSQADVISLSGCKDSQTSADANEGGRATGAMSYAFIQSFTQNPQQTYMQMLISVREILRSKYSQKPQLSSSHPIDTDILFIA